MSIDIVDLKRDKKRGILKSSSSLITDEELLITYQLLYVYSIFIYTTCVRKYSSKPCLPSAPPMPECLTPAWKPCIASKFSLLIYVSPNSKRSTALKTCFISLE